MPTFWTLSLNAGPSLALGAWGLLQPQLVFRSLAEDEFTFAIEGDIVGADCPFAYDDRVTLRRNGEAYFAGTVVAVTTVSDGKREYWSVRACNAVWKLKRLLFQQPTCCYNAACARLTDVYTTKICLFQDAISGANITTGSQIAAAIAYALTKGVLLVAGSAPAFVTVPVEVVRDMTVMGVILRCVEYTPDAVSWCDYSSGVPIFNVQQRALLAGVSVDVDTLETFSLERRDDLVPAGVRFNYIGVRVCPEVAPSGCEPVADGEDQELTTVTQDSSGLPDLPGGIVGTIDLAQIADAGAATPTEEAPLGLAGQYYTSLLTPHWAGRLVIRDRECDGAVRPGKLLNLTGGKAAWATMNAVVQEVTENLERGETIVTVGPPEHLGPQDFVTLLQFTRNRALVVDSYVKTRAPGTAEEPNCDGGKDPAAKKLLDKLKANGAAAAKKIGSGNLGNALTGGSGGGFGTADIELCDPPGSHVTVLTPGAGA